MSKRIFKVVGEKYGRPELLWADVTKETPGRYYTKRGTPTSGGWFREQIDKSEGIVFETPGEAWEAALTRCNAEVERYTDQLAKSRAALEATFQAAKLAESA